MSQISKYSTSGTGGTTTFSTDNGPATPLAGVIQVLGGTGISTSGAGNIILITASATPAFTWQVVTSLSNPVTLTDQTGFIAKGPGVVNFKLPASAAIGFTSRIAGYGNLWTLAQNAGQSIIIGNSTSTIGVGGSVTATMISDGLELVTITANSEFYTIGIQGNPTII